MRWTENKPKPSYLQFAAIDAAWRSLNATYEAAGPTARKRFDSLYLRWSAAAYKRCMSNSRAGE